MNDHYLERALFVVGNRHTGKSTHLRSMFLDVRLGATGKFQPSGSWTISIG